MKHELAEIKKGATWQNIYDCLWVIGTVRYVSKRQLGAHFRDAVWQKKIASRKKLDILVQKGFLKQSPEEVLSLTPKGVTLLAEYSDYNTKIIKIAQGEGKRDSLYNTDVLLEIFQLSDFYALLYPVFYEKKKDDQPFLIPDGAVIFKKDNQAKLVFLEIEREKPDWHGHLQTKRVKYKAIAEKEETWSRWWRSACGDLGINHCRLEDFGFTVWCVGDFKEDWEGWEFTKYVTMRI